MCLLVLASVMGPVPVVSLLLALLLPSLVSCENLLSTMSMVHLGYLHLLSAFLRWSISFWRSSSLWHNVLPLWVMVLITLYVADRWWWLSHCRYWSVWVGFPYTVIDNVLSGSGLTRVSKEGMAPSCLVSSTVTFMASSILLMCSRKFCLCSSFWMTKVSSTYLGNSLGNEWHCLEPLAQNIPYRG